MVILVNLNASNFHNDINEAKADVHAVRYRTFQDEKQQKINKIVILSQSNIKQALQAHT